MGGVGRTVGALTAVVLMLAGCGTEDRDEPDELATEEKETVGLAEDTDPCPRDGNEREVNAQCIDPWPLTEDSGTLRCEGPDAVTIDAAGNRWAVNGMASSHDLGDEIEPIWQENPEIEGTRVKIGGLIDAGLELC
jgi:hypothetical protein